MGRVRKVQGVMVELVQVAEGEFVVAKAERLGQVTFSRESGHSRWACACVKS
ncbi:MAG: hypothetical protein H0X24_01750 [Ktedonobacterales bacterium]|nr:hypothetical protein [Ktedonobacterales bacterium]